jgi:hypothetical protein
MLDVGAMSRRGALVIGVLLVACTEGGLNPPSDDAGEGRRGPMPQGAIEFKSSVAPGMLCSHTHTFISAPSNVAAGVLDALSCDLSTGCKPDQYVVVDRDRGATVTCLVASNGSDFSVSTRLSVDGTSTGEPSISFQLNGVLSPTGGTATISEQNSIGGGGGNDSMCTVYIQQPRGLVKSGGIWGSFQCENFRNPSDISETGCLLEGYFLFENCDS